MDLVRLYDQVAETITSLDVQRIWPGFQPLGFALYNDTECIFAGTRMERPEDFCANTSITYHGEQIAIWKVEDEVVISVLVSKLIHEMFHGFQELQDWDAWANEKEALLKYRYDPENLTLRIRGNELLLSLAESYDPDKFRELLAHRKLRSEKFPYEYLYECKIEEIEGTATYVELKVLEQLDPHKAETVKDKVRRMVTDPACLCPIRLGCYDTGALVVSALLKAGDYSFAPADRPVGMEILRGVEPSDGSFPNRENIFDRITGEVRAFLNETVQIVRNALKRNEIILKGPAELISANIYDARYLEGFLISKYFLMVRVGEKNIVLSGDFVARLEDENTVLMVYRQ